MRKNKREFAVKMETTPGTVIAMTSSDVLVRLRSADDPEMDYEQIDTEEVQGTSSQRPMLIGRRTVGFNISHVLKGSGAVATKPACDPLLRAAMMLSQALKSINIGAVTTGPFLDGQTVTGGTSLATGRVFRNTANGAPALKYIPITGVFQSAEVISGGGVSASSTAGPVDAGTLYQMADSDFDVGGGASMHHVSCELRQDGFFWRARGVLSELTLRMRNGHPAYAEHKMLGAYSLHGDVALYGVTSYPQEAVVAPRLLNAGIKFGAYAPTDVIDVELVIPTAPEVREDANNASADGVLYADYLRTAPTVRLDPAMVKLATKDYFGELIAAGTFALELNLGSAAGNMWSLYADEAQFVRVGTEDRRQLATAPLEIRLNGKSNNEFYLWHH